jgi:hypothetical protein
MFFEERCKTSTHSLFRRIKWWQPTSLGFFSYKNAAEILGRVFHQNQSNDANLAVPPRIDSAGYALWNLPLVPGIPAPVHHAVQRLFLFCGLVPSRRR